MVNKPNPRFRNYRNLFNNLLRVADVVTMYPICSVMITYDSKYAVTVTKRNEREYYIKMYCLEKNDLTFEEKIGGASTDYIKLKEIEQNSAGNRFGAAYNNDGNFRVRTFGVVNRTEDEIKANELDVNALVGIDNWTMAIQGFPDPYINLVFVTDDIVFVCLFHNYTCTHYHFNYDMVKK